MGMKTSRAVFQHLMDWMVGNLQTRCAVVFIGDIIIFSPSMIQQLKDFRDVFGRLQKTELKVFLKLQICIARSEGVGTSGFSLKDTT